MADSPIASRERGGSAYGTTIFLSAFLLFTIQPLIAKRILPWFGGATAVWATCMVFFQLLLLLGYMYVHVLTGFVKTWKTQAVIHFCLLAGALAFLPITARPPALADVSRAPALQVLLLLGRTLGVPFLVLSSTSPLVQVWYRNEKRDTSPYRLYALSNLGSMSALLLYPIVAEPLLRLGTQEWVWSVGFLIYSGVSAYLLWRSKRFVPLSPIEQSRSTPEKLPMRRVVHWVCLSACASVLLLSTTTHLTINVAPIPMLWVLPLALYLLSFILCFDTRAWYRPRLFKPLALATMFGMVLLVSETFKQIATLGRIPLFLLALFSACMVLHGELSRLKPDPSHLTLFYLMIATGGALGGLAVGLVAPLVFNAHYELHLGIIGLGILLAMAPRGGPSGSEPRVRALARSCWIVLALTGVLALVQTFHANASSVAATRNFYGALRVTDEGFGPDRKRVLLDGTITHGMEFLAPDRQLWPTTYFGPSTGIGLALRVSQKQGPMKVGVIGLGAGTLAAYGRPGDVYRFYEINPQVLDVALNHFGFLRQSRARVEVVLGDARLSLDREPSQHYDVLILDAFSSDSIPMHLLTQEAAAIYLRHLKPGGLLCFHISNRYLDLIPVINSIKNRNSINGVELAGYSKDELGTSFARWVILSDNYTHILPLTSIGEPLDGAPVNHWTDDYSNLISSIRW